MTTKALTRSNDYFPVMFDDYLKPWTEWFTPSEVFSRSHTMPPANVTETKDEYVVSVAAPGLKKDDFKVQHPEEKIRAVVNEHEHDLRQKCRAEFHGCLQVGFPECEEKREVFHVSRRSPSTPFHCLDKQRKRQRPEYQPRSIVRPPFAAGLSDMNCYFSRMHGHGCCCFQDLLADFAYAPALLCDALHQRSQTVQHLISVETQQQADLIAAHHLLHGRRTTAGRR